jgi:fibronectin type 3 domain-containing protein
MTSAFILDPDDGNYRGGMMDKNGDLYLIGTTTSSSLDVTNSSYDDSLGGDQDAFIMTIGKNLSGIKYCTYFGGSGNETGVHISQLNEHELCFTGATTSSDLPTTGGASDTSYNSQSDVYITVLNTTSGTLRYSSYLGGSQNEYADKIAVEDYNTLVLLGITDSFDFPVTLNAFDNTRNGGYDCFIVKFDITSNCPKYSTFLGSTQNDFPSDLYVKNGEAHVIGTAIHQSFPTTSDAYDTSLNGFNDVFYSVISTDGSQLQYSTFIGGTSYENSACMIIDEYGNLIMAGDTASGNFPTTTGAFQTSHRGANDAFLLKFSIHARPGTPKNTKARCGDNFINLTWEPARPLSGLSYWIYKGTDMDNIVRFEQVEDVTFYNDTDVKNGIEYIYRISAENEFGESDPTQTIAVIPGGCPSEPFNLKAEGKKNAVALTWNPPNTTRGFPVTGYRVLRGEEGYPLTHYRSLRNFTSFEDTYVKNGQTYDYVIIAENDRGEGPSSQTTSIIPGSIPERIAKLEIAEGDRSLSLKWNIPEDNGFSIEEYIIYRGPERTEMEEIGRAGTNTYLDTDLENGATYFYSVSAVNERGESEGNVIASSMPSSVPGMVILDFEEGDGYAYLHWSSPDDAGGLEILRYNIYKAEKDGELQFFISTKDLFFNDTGLENGITYHYSVSALNSNGEGQLSEIVNAIPKALPGYPIGLDLELVENTIMIEWEPPSVNGGLYITEYRIFKGSDESDLTLMEIVDSTSFIDTVFEWGQTYAYAVSAVNDLGEGPLSPVRSIEPKTLPGPPQDVTHIQGTDHVLLRWSAPDLNGGDAVSEYAVYRGTSPDYMIMVGVINQLEFNDTGLEPNTTYHYIIKAVNSVGEGAGGSFIEIRTLPEESDDDEIIDPVVRPPSKEGSGDGTLIIIVISTILILLLSTGLIILGVIIMKRRSNASALPPLPIPPPQNIYENIPQPELNYPKSLE